MTILQNQAGQTGFTDHGKDLYFSIRRTAQNAVRG